MLTSRAMMRAVKRTAGGSPFVVRIGGPTPPGKSTLALSLAEQYKEFGLCQIDQDSWYLGRLNGNR